jgi:hypothetical protein
LFDHNTNYYQIEKWGVLSPNFLQQQQPQKDHDDDDDDDDDE